MYDTLNFYIDYLDDIDIDALCLRMSEGRQTTKDNGFVSRGGRIGAYNVTIFGNKVCFNGSLSEFANPSNLYELGRKDVKRAAERLSVESGINVLDAVVTRLDIAGTIETKKPAPDYFNCFGAKSRFTRVLATDKTLYYNCSSEWKKIAIYDKKAEARKKGKAVPTGFEDMELLRFEVRYLKDVPKQLKHNGKVKVRELWDGGFYANVRELWLGEYESIAKHKKNELRLDGEKTPKEVEQCILGYFLNRQDPGELDEIRAQIKRSVPNRCYRSRIESDLRKAMNEAKVSECEMVDELDNKMRARVNKIRC